MKQLYLIGFCWMLAWQVYATEAGKNFAKALEYQQQGQTQQAIELYEKIIKEGFTSSELHNNLGLAYYENKQIGKAIVHFERALRLNPNNDSARNNLQVASHAIPERVAPAKEMGIVALWNSVRQSLSANAWGVVVLLWLSATSLGIFFIRTAPKRLWYGLTASFGVLSIVAMVMGVQQSAWEEDSQTAVLIKPKMNLRNAPSPQSQELNALYEGTTCTLLEHQNSWWRVQLANGMVGWLPNSVLEKI